VAKHQLTCSGGGVNMPLVREELNGRPVAMRLCGQSQIVDDGDCFTGKTQGKCLYLLCRRLFVQAG